MFNSREVKDGFVFLPFEVSDHAKLWSLHWWQMVIGPGECENGRIFGESIWVWINTYFHTIFRGMNIHKSQIIPAILMWTTGVQGFDTLPYENFPSDWWFQYVSMIVYFQHFSTLERGWWSRLTSTKFFASPQPVMGHGLIRTIYGNCYSFFQPGPPIVFFVDAMAHSPWFFHLLSGAKRKLSWQGRLLHAV